MKEIPLTDGFTALVDDEDFEALSKFTWHVHRHGRMYYPQTTIYKGGKKTIRMHRMVVGCNSKILIDHKDGNGMNNTRENLRVATSTQNNRNARLRKDSTTGFKGVHFKKASRKFQAHIRVDGERIYLGCFLTPEEAHAAYCKAAQRHFGVFARFQ